jgi:hypothetical protein
MYGLINTWEVASSAQILRLFDNFDDVNDVLPFFDPTADDQDGTIWNGWSSTPRPLVPDDNLTLGIGYYEPDDYYQESVFTTGRDISLKGAWVKSVGAPVPVPSTILLFGPGLMALAWIKRRFRHK